MRRVRSFRLRAPGRAPHSSVAAWFRGLCLVWLILLPCLGGPLAAKDKMNVQDLVARHLSSIGPREKLAALKTRVVEGRAAMKIEVGGVGGAVGRAVIASDGDRYRIALPFDYTDYWGEQLLFDGKSAQVGFAQIQKRSTLGDFVYRYDQILQEGLVGGVLSTAWPLLNRDEKQPKLSYAGLKKVEGRELHQVNYMRKKGQADMRIQLFFEPDTFRHVRTVYQLFIQSEASTNLAVEASGEQGSHYKLEERFDDFKTFDGLTLPTRWNVMMEVSGSKTQGFRDFKQGGGDAAAAGRTGQREWAVIVDKVVDNQPIDPRTWVLVPAREKPSGGSH